MKNFKLILLSFLLLSLFSCVKNDNYPNLIESDKELLSFSFELENNADFLSQTLIASLDEDKINIQIKEVVDTKKLIASFDFIGEAVYVAGQEQVSGETENDFSKPVVYEVFGEDGSKRTYEVVLFSLPNLSSKVPHIYISVDDNLPVTSKEDYLYADILIDGKGVFEDFNGRTRIRGRGNDSWNMPKKPYRLKLDDKIGLLGLLPEKDWILRANYRGESLMLDAVGFRAAALLGMPYTNHAVPVDVSLNGTYLGSYMFTEHKEVKANRINVGPNGMYLDIDVYMNKPPNQFYSEHFNLPIIIKYPKSANAEIGEVLDYVKTEFHTMEAEVAAADFPNSDYLNYFEALDYVNYMIVYNLTLNREINHPKSTYMHKHEGGKFKMGPVWDFDWGFGYDPNTDTHFNMVNEPLFVASDMTGKVFFESFLQDPYIQELYKSQWEEFKINGLPELYAYIEAYAEIISESYDLNYAIWGQGIGSSEQAAQQLISWLQNRANYIDAYLTGF